MDANALKYLKEMVEEANPGGRIVTCDREPRHVYYVEGPNRELVRTEAKSAPDNHKAADLATLVRVAVALIATPDGDASGAPQIWYGRNEVVAVLNPFSAHPDHCRVSLAPSPQLAKLAEWDRAGRASVTQQDLVVLVRTLFTGCLPSDFLPLIRGVKVNKKNDIDSQIQQGKVSLGKSIVAEMTGAAAIPERVTFRVPVFAQAAVPINQDVRVEIDPDPQNERFNLIVIPGDIETAFAQAEEVIANRLEKLLDGAPIPVYRGAP